MSVIKHTDPVPDPRAVNQDKKNMLFSVSDPHLHSVISLERVRPVLTCFTCFTCFTCALMSSGHQHCGGEGGGRGGGDGREH